MLAAHIQTDEFFQMATLFLKDEIETKRLIKTSVGNFDVKLK